VATISKFGADACNLLILEDDTRVFRHPDWPFSCPDYGRRDVASAGQLSRGVRSVGAEY